MLCRTKSTNFHYNMSMINSLLIHTTIINLLLLLVSEVNSRCFTKGRGLFGCFVFSSKDLLVLPAVANAIQIKLTKLVSFLFLELFPVLNFAKQLIIFKKRYDG